MKLGFVSDAHGNPFGLEGCLRALRVHGAERVYFLGDAVGYLPEENAVLDLLRSHEALCVRGNHEAFLLGELPVSAERDRIYRIAEARARIAPGHTEWIKQWPIRLELTMDGVRFLLVHGSPAHPLTGYVYPDSDLGPVVTAAAAADIVLMGHTHRAFGASLGRVTIINVGSSGMPRDVGNLASCALVDSSSGAYDIFRVRFDARALVARWRGRIDPAAAECLQRSATGHIVGRVLAP